MDETTTSSTSAHANGRDSRAGDPEARMFRHFGEVEIARRMESGEEISLHRPAGGDETGGTPAATAIAEPDERVRFEALGRLAAGVAHDFNNLLSVILTCASELERDLPPGEERDRANEIHQAAERGASLTSQVLTQTYERPVERTPTDVSDAAASAVRLLERTLGPGITLKFEAAGALPHALLGAGQVEQVLINLAGNARDAMPGGGALLIRTGITAIDLDDPRLGPGWYVGIEVTDTGAGMPAHVLERAFDPFFTTRGDDGGTGLGLASVQEIARASGGDVRIASKPGVGTTVSVLFAAVRKDGTPLAMSSPLPGDSGAGPGARAV